MGEHDIYPFIPPKVSPEMRCFWTKNVNKTAGIIIITAIEHIPAQSMVNCAVKSISPTVNVFESVLLARFDTSAYSFHEIKNANIPALILTFMVQKHLVTGLTFGGVKG